MATIRLPVEILRERLHELEEQVGPQLQEIDLLRDAIAKLEGTEPTVGVTTSADERPRRVSVMPALEEILKAEPKREFHASELVALLEQRGIPMKQVNPENTVATAMVRLAERGAVTKLGNNKFRARDEREGSGEESGSRMEADV